MRFIAGFLWILAFTAQPALAEAPPRLKTLEQQLASLEFTTRGDVGIAALDLATGELVSVHGDDPFPMASTVKIAIAANYLAQVEHGRRTLDHLIRGRPARQLLEAMLIHSDNVATDMVLRDLGGPKTVQNWFTQQGIADLRIDRTIAQLLSARRDLHDTRDSSTPRAMVDLLRRLDSGQLLSPSSRSYLLGLMGRCATGKNRIRGFLPPGVKVENKTGTLSGLTTDVGFLTLPDGRRIAVALFARAGTNRAQAIARAARAIYDGFSITRFASYGGSQH
jgi:beta-lactamase class A